MKETEKKPQEPGPVITISREYGCLGFTFAEEMAREMSKTSIIGLGVKEWHAFNKLIIAEAAKSVNITPEMAERFSHQKPNDFFGEVFSNLFKSFSDYYVPSDIEVKKVVAGIVRNLAVEGCSIIVGRAGVVIASDIPKSLHIRLYAPENYRVKLVSEKENITEAAARTKINTIDRERVYFRNFFAGEELNSNIFDVAFNTSTIGLDAMKKAVLELMKDKKIIA